MSPAAGAGDPTLQHPLDLRAARPVYRWAAALRALTSPAVSLAAIMLLWVVSDNLVTPVVGPVLGVSTIAYVERRCRADAWAHVARGRQDAGRDDPAAWSAAAVAFEVLVFAGACAVFVPKVGVEAGPTAVAPIAAGMAVGLLVCSLAASTWDRRAPRERRVDNASHGVVQIRQAGILVVSGTAVAMLSERAVLMPPAVALGAALALAVGAIGLLARLIPSRVRCLPERFLQVE
ncbi:hypothetical protein [Agromyces salentinus]|uniref:Uncharacterized protein n=1 Tax=Agromyces salentinus TaxID=269421 RepID=A0ABN2MHL6_9MICO|nr:hypothetical protein [Agromyces salentinus]